MRELSELNANKGLNYVKLFYQDNKVKGDIITSNTYITTISFDVSCLLLFEGSCFCLESSNMIVKM